MVKHAPWAATLAAVAAFVTLAGFTLTDKAPGSSPERTAYSAVAALKHKNFGRFCSYLTQEFRGDALLCATNNALNWAQFASFWGIDLFDESARVVANYRVDVDDNTVSFVVQLPTRDAFTYYRFTVEKQENGRWRISAIEPLESLLEEAARAAATGTPAEVS